MSNIFNIPNENDFYLSKKTPKRKTLQGYFLLYSLISNSPHTNAHIDLYRYFQIQDQSEELEGTLPDYYNTVVLNPTKMHILG